MAAKTGKHAAPPPETPGRPGRRKASARKRKRTPRAIMVLRIVFALAFCVAAYRIADALVSNSREQHTFRELQVIKAQSAAQAAQGAAQATDTPETGPQQAEQAPQGTATDVPAEAAPPTGPVPLPQYAQLRAMNSEFFGWLTIEGLEIDYPIMYAPARSEYYLNRDFYGKYSDSGIPFIDGRCPADGNYYLIYGHKMVNGSVFGRLPRYAEESCWQENPVIRFDTVFEERQYAVMACFYSRLYGGYEPGFRFYEYFDLTSADVFNEYVEQVSVAALYETGVTAEYGDELLVLSTCSHYVEDGRFAVVAKRIA